MAGGKLGEVGEGCCVAGLELSKVAAEVWLM